MTPSTPEQVSTHFVEVLKDKQSVTEGLQQLNEELKDMQLDEQREVFSSVSTKLDGLRPEELRQIDANIEALNIDQLQYAWAKELTSIQLATKKRLESMKQEIESQKTPERKGVVENVKGFFSDQWAGAKEWWDAKTPESRQRISTIGAAAGVSIAAYGAFRLAYRFFVGTKKRAATANEQAHEVANASKGGWFKKALLYSATAGAVFVGGKYAIDYIAGKWSVNGVMGAVGEQVNSMLKPVYDFMGSFTQSGREKESQEKYGISAENAERIETSYKEKVYLSQATKKNGYQEVRAELEASGATPEQAESFIRRMDEKYQIVTLEDYSEVSYVTPELAYENYKTNVVVAANQFVQLVNNYKVEAVASALVVAKVASMLSVDKALFTGARLSFEQAKNLTTAIAKLSYKHPIVTLFLFTGAGIALHETISRVKKGTSFVPENMSDLVQVCLDNKPLILGDMVNFAEDQVQTMREYAVEIGSIGKDVASWISTHIGSFLQELVVEGLPDALTSTPAETAKYRNQACIENFQMYLWSALEDSKTNQAEGMYPKFQVAYAALDDYERVIQSERLEQIKDSSAPEMAFIALKAALAEVNISLFKQGGIVKWKAENRDRSYDLSVDPSITDQDNFIELSRKLDHGQGWVTFVAERTFEQFREQQQAGLETAQATLPFMENRLVALVVGNFVYFADPSNLVEYWLVPLDLCMDALFDKDKTGNEWGATVSAGFMTTAMFSVGTIPLRVVRRLAVGGGRLVNPSTTMVNSAVGWGKWAGVNITPGFSHRQVLIDAYHGANDFKLVTQKIAQAKSAREVFSLWQEARHINNIFSRAGVRPEWLRIVETGSFKEINDVIGKMGLRNLAKGKELAEVRQIVKNEIILRLNAVPRREYTAFSRAASAGKGLDATDLYDDVLKMTMKEGLDIATKIPQAIDDLRALYKGPALILFDDALLNLDANKLVHSVDDAVKIMSDPVAIKVLGRGNAAEIAALKAAAEVGGTKSVQAVQRCSQYINALDDMGKLATSPHLLNPKIISEIMMESAIHPEVAARYFAHLPPNQLANGVGYFRRQMAAIRSNPGMFGFAVAAEALGVGLALYEIHQQQKRMAETKQHIETLLDSATRGNTKLFRRVRSGDEVIYQHVENPAIQINLTSIVDHGLERFDDAGKFQLAVAGGSLATTVLNPCLALGPMGLVYGAVVLSVHLVGTEIVNQRTVNALLTRDLPLPILAQLGTELFTQESNLDTIKSYSNWMIGLSAKERAEGMKHLFAVRFFAHMQQIGQVYPGVVQEIYGGRDAFEFLANDGDFFRHDFPQIIAPYIAMRIFEDSNEGSGMTWGMAKELSVMSDADEWFRWVGMHIDKVDDAVLDRAITESAWTYATHVRQTSARSKLFAAQQQLNNESQKWAADAAVHDQSEFDAKVSSYVAREQLQEYIEQLKNQKVLGTTVGALWELERTDLSEGGIQQYGAYESAISRLIQQQFNSMNNQLNENSTVEEARKLPGNIFALTLPAYLQAGASERTLPLRQLHVEGLDIGMLIGTPDKKQQYDHVLLALDMVRDLLRMEGKTIMDGWVISEDEYNVLLDYSRLLHTVPELDTYGIAAFIQALPRKSWNMMNGSQKWERLNKFKELLQAQKLDLKARYYELFPPEALPAPDRLLKGENKLIYPPWYNAYGPRDRVATTSINKTLELLNVGGEMVLSEDGTYYRRRTADGSGWREYEYYTQRDGTVYAKALEEGKQDMVTSLSAGKLEWKVATPQSRVHDFNHRFDREVYVKCPNGSEVRVEALTSVGSQVLPEGMGTVHFSTIEAKLIDGGTTELLNWEFEGKKPGTYLVFRKNHLGVSQPPQYFEVVDEPPKHTELLSGPNYHIYPHHQFGCHIELTDGTMIDIPEKRHRNMNEIVREINQKCSGVLRVSGNKTVDVRGRIYFSNTSQYNWTPEYIGWRFDILDRSKLKVFELGSEENIDRTREVVDFTPQVQDSSIDPHSIALPETLDADLETKLSHAGVLWPHLNFSMEVELSDGRTMLCTRDNQAVWAPYLKVVPSNTSRGAQTRADDGWFIIPRNRTAITRMVLLYKKENKRLTLRVSQ